MQISFTFRSSLALALCWLVLASQASGQSDFNPTGKPAARSGFSAGVAQGSTSKPASKPIHSFNRPKTQAGGSNTNKLPKISKPLPSKSNFPPRSGAAAGSQFGGGSNFANGKTNQVGGGGSNGFKPAKSGVPPLEKPNLLQPNPVSPPRSPSRPFGTASSTKPDGLQKKRSLSASSSSPRKIDVETCTVTLIEDILVPAKESGVLVELNVKEGQAVPSGKQIGTIDDAIYRIELERARQRKAVAQLRASDETAMQAAKYKWKLAKDEFGTAQRLLEKRARSMQEYKRAQYSVNSSQAEYAAAKMQKKIAGQEEMVEQAAIEQVETRLENLKIIAPFDGHVMKIEKDPSEWVNQGDVILRFARVDRLRVEGLVRAEIINPAEVLNQPVTATMLMARGQEVSFPGKIVAIPLEMEGNGRSFRVVAEVENRFENGVWLIRPGAQMSMTIEINPATANRPTASRPIADLQR